MLRWSVMFVTAGCGFPEMGVMRQWSVVSGQWSVVSGQWSVEAFPSFYEPK
jgi:hypothetical protein